MEVSNLLDLDVLPLYQQCREEARYLHNAALQLIKHPTLWLAVKLGLELRLLLNVGLSLLGLSLSVPDSLLETSFLGRGGNLLLALALLGYLPEARLGLGGGDLMLVEVLHGGS